MDEFVRILEIIQQGQTKALQAANYHFLEVYWQSV